MVGIVDFHTHAFPDQIAASAIASLEQAASIKACVNGTIAALLHSMDHNGIDISVLCCIATRPAQFRPILDWSRAIRSERIIPLPSLHPDDPKLLEHLAILHAEGFLGIKMHSYYQNYRLDDPRVDDLHGMLAELGMILVIHAGFDKAYPRKRVADPQRILDLSRHFPALKVIATHMGGLDDWEEARRVLVGKPIHLELSLALDELDPAKQREMLLAHPPEYLLFGSDSPWKDQAVSLDQLHRLDLPEPLIKQITVTNARRLLGL